MDRCCHQHIWAGFGVLFSPAPGLLWPSQPQPHQTSGLAVPPVCLSCHLLPVSSVLWASAQMSTHSLLPRDEAQTPWLCQRPFTISTLQLPPLCPTLMLISFSRPYHPVCDLPPTCMPLRTDGPGQASRGAPKIIHSFTYTFTSFLAPPFPHSLPLLPSLIP